MNDSFITGEAGLSIIRDCEGLRTTSYRCPAGIPTIGYGHTGPEVKDGQTITKEEADRLLRDDVKVAERAIKRLVKVQLTQGQFDALVSFTFNLGAGNLQSSTLLKKLNASDYAGAAEQFLVWNKAAGKVLPGLVKRRERERQCFLS